MNRVLVKLVDINLEGGKLAWENSKESILSKISRPIQRAEISWHSDQTDQRHSLPDDEGLRVHGFWC